MAVKTAVSEVRRLHNVGDANAAETPGAKQAARRIKDAFAGFGRFLPAHFHVRPRHASKND